MNNFKDFNFPATIEKALAEMHFDTPTPIQAQAIPVVLEGKDLLGCAQTGTGKTAAFCLPILTQLLNRQNQANALILVPTRELAVQIDIFWKKITRHTPGMHSAVIIGGMPMRSQVHALGRQPRLIIATPGRLVDHLQRQSKLLSKASILVLDEADRMLDMGFAPQLSQIMRQVPTQRQTLFFTATWASELDQFAKRYLRNPVRVTVGEVSRAAPQITQTTVMTTASMKNESLLDELNKCTGSVLVFTKTKSRTDRVAQYLSEYGVQVSRMHGGRSQGQRNLALAAFRSGKSRVLVATDIAARGIDVEKIGHVINYDLPQSSEDYIHRIGRTGRAGETGQAISLLTPEDRQQWRQIQKLISRSDSQVPSFGNEKAGSKKPHFRSEKSRFNPKKNSKDKGRFSSNRGRDERRGKDERRGRDERRGKEARPWENPFKNINRQNATVNA